MITGFRKTALASALAAMTLAGASPAMAQGYPGGYGGYDNYGNGGYRHRDRGDSTGAAIVGGIVGIAIGALIASSGNKNRNRYRDRGWEYRDGYYWDRDGRRYDRDGRNCDEDNGYSRQGDGNYGRDGYRGDEGYYGRRGYRDGDGYYRGN